MNISTTTRRLAQGLLVLCFTLATMVGAKAQCDDFATIPSGPVTINMTLSGGGFVTLTDAILNGSGFYVGSDFFCGMWLSSDPDPNNLGSYLAAPITFGCADIGSTTWHIRAGGDPIWGISTWGGPGATIIDITINVIDNISPTISCPANRIRNAGAACKYTTAGSEFNWLATADNCSAIPTYQLSGATSGSGGATLNGKVFNSGVTTVKWNVADQALPSPNTASCSFTVTVNDATPPTITCPANVVAPNAPANASCQWVGTGLGVTDAMVADNCASDASLLASLSNNKTGPGNLNGYNFPLGVTNVTYTITDGVNAPVSCSYSVNVTDQTNPVITCPSNKTVNALGLPSCDYTVSGTSFNASATDNCSLAGLPSNNYTGTNTLNAAVFTVGTTNVTWTATDNAARVSTCSFSVTVKDVTPPTVTLIPPPNPSGINFQAVFNVNTAPGSCTQNVSWYRPSWDTHDVSDCNWIVSFTENDTVSINCPGLSCVSDPTFLTTNGVTPYPYDPNNFFHRITPVSANFPVGTTVITYEVEDVYGNTTPITVTVNVSELEAPVANCIPGTVTVVMDPFINQAVVTPAMVNNGSSDNCGIKTMTVSPTSFNCNSLGNQTVTLTVTDNASNSATCMANVYVLDNSTPAIGCPASFVVPNFPANSCAANVPGLIFNQSATHNPGPQEFWDNTFNNCGLTFDYSINGAAFSPPTLITVGMPVDLSGVTFPAGNNTVTLRAKDGSANIGICNFSVNVQDQTPPQYAAGPNPGPVPGSTILANVPNLGSCTSRAIWSTPLFSDNCSAATIISQSAFSNVTIFSADNGGISPVTYLVRDVAGNLYSYTFNVHAVDSQAPVAKCKDITVNLSATIGAGSVVVTPAQIDNASTDNCGYSYVSGNATYTCANIGPNNYTLQIQDDAGNPSSCIGVVTVKDITPPILTCPSDVTIFTPVLPSPASCVGSATGTLSAVDNCTVSAYQYALGSPAGAFTTFAGGDLANIPVFPLGVTNVTVRALDGVLPTPNISNLCAFTVTLKDITPPVFASVPANVTVACDAILPVTNPTATDNCGSATVTYKGQTFGPGLCTYTITRTWEASDNAVPSNTIQVSQVITVQDIVGPVFNAAYLPTGIVNVNVSGPSSCTGNYTLAVVNFNDITDACNGISGISYSLVPAVGAPSSGVLTFALGTHTLPVSSFPIGTNIVTLTATDGCGNPTVKVITIIVTDNQSPVFMNNYAVAPAGICGDVFTLPNTTNNCDQLFTWIRPSLTDITDCGAFTVTEVINNQSVQSFVNLINPFPVTLPAIGGSVIAQFPVGETTVTYTATQGANPPVVCSFIIKIIDTQAPSITCPGNQNLSVSAGCSADIKVPTYPPASISDNCLSDVTIIQTPPANALVSSVIPVTPGNFFVVTLKAINNMPDNLMSAPCSFNITLVDGQAPVPVITTLGDIVSNCTKETVTAPSATDCNGTDLVTIYGTPSVPVMMVLPPLVPGGPPRYVLNPGSYVINWSYTDPENNTTSQPQNVIISVDLTPPVAIGQSLNINLDAAGDAFITAVQLNNGSYDQDGCGPVDISIRTGVSPNYIYLDTLDFDCSNLANMGVNAVVLAVTDINGNIGTFQTTVTVHDVTQPVFAGTWSATQMDTVIQACSAIPPAASYPQFATDQCDVLVDISLVETSTIDTIGCGKYSYLINRKWTAMDDAGNTAIRTQKIVVSDAQAPVYAVNTPATVVGNTTPNALDCKAAVNFNIAPYVADCESTSDLTITNTLISAPPGNTFVIPSGSNISAPDYPVGTYVVRFTATDKCGNSSTKNVTIQVNDATPPTAVCINGVSASLQPSGIVNVMFNQFNNFSFDNCTSNLGLLIQRLDQSPLVPPTTTLAYDCADADGVTQHGVKLFVSDASGNMSMCLTYIVIQDNVAPTITCPPNKTVQCTDNLSTTVQGEATATDNCLIVVDSISHTDALSNGVGNICQVLTRTWKVVDLADNVSTCDQLLSIQDTIKPVFSVLPPNVTVSCSDGNIAVIPVTATDNCDADVLVELTVDTIAVALGDCGMFDYSILRTWTATDNCGNTNVYARTIKVVDVTEPVFAGMPDTLILNTSQFPPNQNCTVPLVFNVAQFLEDCTPDNLLLVTNDGPFGDHSFSISGDYLIGNYWIYFAAIDVCGNVGVDSINISVIDNSVPTMICNNNVIISLGTNGSATIDPSNIDLGSTDNCSIDTLFLSKSTFDCGDLGTQTISLTAVDIYGNTNSCVVQVQVMLGVNTGFILSASGTPELYFSADNGTATTVTTGGSGIFSYEWSNMATTANLNGLSAGTYTVTATDVSSGCIAVDTAIVQAGPKITITVGTGNGCQGQTISIPVTVDNFINVSGFSLGLALSNGVIGTITGLTNLNPALVGLVPGVSSVFWTHPTLNPTTLPNGSLLFNLQVQLSAAAVGTSVNILASALPALVFLQDGTNQAPMVNFNNGSATITCPASNDLNISGDVFTWKAPTKPIPGVTVDLAGTNIDMDLTALPTADYGFLVQGGSNTVVSAFKIATVKNQQINVGDMLGIQAHAAMQVSFTNGYQWVAADINGDFKINLLDYALVQRYVLGNAPHFTNVQGNQVGPDWKFIAASHVFLPLPMGNPPAPQVNPLNNPVPPSLITHNNVAADFLSDDFTGVLMGDVNGSVVPSLTNGGGGAEFTDALKFRLDERAVQAGETITIPFKAKDFINAQAYQMTIAFDPEVFELQDIQAGVLPGLTQDNFGTANLADGLISTLWVGGKPTSFNDDETLFSLTFKVLKSVPTLSAVLKSSSEITEALAINEGGNAIAVGFEFVASVATGDLESKTFALFQNQPNPFTAQTTISFRLPESGRATLRVFSAEGRLVKTVIGDFAEGKNSITFQKSDFGSNGVFYYELATPKHSDRKKMILID